ncbi:hypothetical protein JHK87_022345 [Glycine soja]|nr:hypothetical protein JHK87_022345 [Glycine soja]
MEATLPSNWKNLNIEKYDGTTDSDEHLDVYITQMNELIEYQNQVRANVVSTKKDNDRPSSNKARDEGRRDQPLRESCFTQYILVTASRSRIMDQALVVNILTMPKRTNTPPKADYSKRCRCHCNCDHLTEECNALKDKIYELIKLGHLKEFVHNPQLYRPEGRNRPKSS